MSKTLFSMVISKRKFTWHYLLVWSPILPWMSESWSTLYMDWNRLFKPSLTNFEPPCFSFLFSKASMTLPCFFARHLWVLFFSLSMLMILLLLGQIPSWLPVSSSIFRPHFIWWILVRLYTSWGWSFTLVYSWININIRRIWLLWQVFRIPPWILFWRLTWSIVKRKATSFLILMCFVN
jgi:hypothetical protein